MEINEFANIVKAQADRKTDGPVKPAVGMGGTHQVGSDSYSYTIVEVSASGKTIKAQRDTATRTDSNGMSESQTYEFSPNPNGPIETFTLRNNGHFYAKGQTAHYHPFLPGKRRSYWDPSF